MSAQDFKLSLEMCCDYMQDENAVGGAYVFTRDETGLHMYQVSPEAIIPELLSQYDLVLFDAGNSFGDSWMHVFHPKQQAHSFVQEEKEMEGLQISEIAPASELVPIEEPSVVPEEQVYETRELSGKEDREL